MNNTHPGMFQLLLQQACAIKQTSSSLSITWENPHWNEATRLAEDTARTWTCGDREWLERGMLSNLVCWALDILPRPFVVDLSPEEAAKLQSSLRQYCRPGYLRRAAELAGDVPARGWLCTVAGIHVVEWPAYTCTLTDEQLALLNSLSDAQIERELAVRRARRSR